ncbi:MAG: ABC transporter permease subunit [Thermoplasmata archaeon]
MYSGVLFYSDGAYHFEFYAFNQYGSPLPAVNYSISISQTPNGPIVTNLSGNTASNGMLELSAALPSGSYLAVIDAGPQGVLYWAQGASNAGVYFGSLPSGEVVPLSGPISTAVDSAIGFSGKPALQIFFPTPIAECVSGCPVYYALENFTNGSSFGPLPESSMTFLGDLASPLQIFPLTIHQTSNTNYLNLQVEIFSPSGSRLALDTNCSASSFYPYQTPSSVSNAAFNYFADEVVLVLPFMAIIASFSVYARDRISGVLESTLVQPVTMRGLATSRFLAALTALLFAVGVGIALSDGLMHLAVGSFVLPSYLLSIYLGFVIVIAFFVGLVFLLSHLVRSTATLLAVGMGLFLLFGIFWNSLVFALEPLFGVSIGTRAGATFQVGLSFLDPLQYPALFLAAITNATPNVATGIGGSPAAYGITPVTLTLASLSWVVIPFVLLLWRIRTRD